MKICQLIGLMVVDEHGEEKGKIIDVYTQSAHDIYVVDWNGREILIPAVGEFIKKIDLENKRIYISEQEGLFE